MPMKQYDATIRKPDGTELDVSFDIGNFNGDVAAATKLYETLHEDKIVSIQERGFVSLADQQKIADAIKDGNPPPRPIDPITPAQ